MNLTFPADDNRVAIVGQTGSGKTHFGTWMLSQRSYDEMPWIIIDSKRDDIIKDIPRTEEIRIESNPPTRKGLYVVRPRVVDFEKHGPVTQFLYKCMANGDTGIFIDEGYSFDWHDPGLKTVLTQGRSKRVPVIALSQKPAWVSPFLFSESEFKAIFYLDMPQDIQRVQEWMPRNAMDPVTGRRLDPSDLPTPGHCYWRHQRKEIVRLGPCEDKAVFMQRFHDRAPRRVWI